MEAKYSYKYKHDNYLGPVHDCDEPVVHRDDDVPLPHPAPVGGAVHAHRLYDQLQPALLTSGANIFGGVI